MGFPISEIALASGMQLYAEPGPFMSKAGTLIGFKQKLIISVGLRGQDGRVCILARWKAATDANAMIKALKADAAMKKMYTLADIKMTGPQSLVWTFSKPMRFKVVEFAQALDSMAATMSQFAHGFDPGKCEGCGAAVNTLTLANGIPNLMCGMCQVKVTSQQAQARQEYERRQPNAARALLYGAATALTAGPLAALLMYWDISGDDRYSVKLFGILTVGIAVGVAWAVKTGVRRVTYGACALATVLTIIGKALCDTLFFGMYFAKLEGWPLSAGLFVNCLLNLPGIKWDFNGFLAGMDVIVVLLSGYFCWKMQPKFAVTFKEIAMPPSINAEAAMTMSASV